MKDRIWFLSEIYYPVDTSTGYYITEIAETFSKEGLDVHILTTKLKYTVLDGEMKNREVHNNVKIHRFTPIFYQKKNGVKRAINALYVSIVLALNLLFKASRKDKIFAVTNPIFLILFLPIIKNIKQLDYTLLVHDVFPENLFAIRKKRDISFKDKILKKIFDWGYRCADKCIVIGRDMEEIISQKRKSNQGVFFIPIWSENESVFPKNKEETLLLKNKEFINKRIIEFAGNLGLAQGLDFILESIAKYEFENLHFLFIGEGAFKQNLMDFSKINCNIDVLNYQKRDSQNDFLNACDIALVTLSSGMYGLGVPSKTYNLLAAGKPILLIADKLSEIGRLIDEYDIGWVVEPNDSKSLLNLLISLDNISNEVLSKKTKNCRKLAETIFARENVLKTYIKVVI